MIQKKSNKANLEKKRIFFFEYGVVLILAFLLFAFEKGNTFSDENLYANDISGENIVEELIPLTKQEVAKPAVPVRPEEFIIVDNSEPELEDIEIDWGSEIGLNENVDLTFYEPEEEAAESEIFVIVQKMPKYRGGTEADFQKHLQQLVKYPDEAQEMGIQGKVFLRFIVDENGQLTKPEIVQTAHELLSNAVLEALDKTERWKAGEQRGRKVKVCFTVPIFFRLD
jgi:periplasmic protein TonB